MAFSPDSTKLAVAQSDGIVFVYKLGLKWGEKKSICNKFPLSSPVTCLVWPTNRQNDVVFGLADGKVKIGNIRHNVSFLTNQYVFSYHFFLLLPPSIVVFLSIHSFPWKKKEIANSTRRRHVRSINCGKSRWCQYFVGTCGRVYLFIFF